MFLWANEVIDQNKPEHYSNIPTSQWQACIFRGWDLRNTVAPVIDLEGHQYAVRRVKVGCENNM